MRLLERSKDALRSRRLELEIVDLDDFLLLPLEHMHREATDPTAVITGSGLTTTKACIVPFIGSPPTAHRLDYAIRSRVVSRL